MTPRVAALAASSPPLLTLLVRGACIAGWAALGWAAWDWRRARDW